MNNGLKHAAQNARAIEGRAAHWLARREAANWSPEDQQELNCWLEEDFAHKAAYWRLEEGWRRADRVSALGLCPQYGGILRQRFTEAWKPLSIAASLALLAFIGLIRISDFGVPAEHPVERIATELGGHKMVELNDGSRIELNTLTMVTAAVTKAKREVWLERGEAFFDIRHSKDVPFIVHAGGKTVTVLGTKFTVRRDGDKVTVAVLQGRVRISETAPAEASVATLVPAGSIAVTESDATLVTEDAPSTVQAKMAWRDGQLILRNDSLAEAAAEFNRYNERKLIISGKAAELRIGGSFKASNVDGFSRLLRDAYGLNVITSDDEIRVTE